MSERGSFKVEYELRFPVHLPDGIFVYFASGLLDRDCSERVCEVLIRAKADQEGVAQQMAQLAAERIHVALAGVQADNKDSADRLGDNT